jgi:hypothetical protein
MTAIGSAQKSHRSSRITLRDRRTTGQYTLSTNGWRVAADALPMSGQIRCDVQIYCWQRRDARGRVHTHVIGGRSPLKDHGRSWRCKCGQTCRGGWWCYVRWRSDRGEHAKVAEQLLLKRFIFNQPTGHTNSAPGIYSGCVRGACTLREIRVETIDSKVKTLPRLLARRRPASR